MVNEIKNAAIAQINMSYSAPEDRVAFRIGMTNQTELIVWITRRISKVIWQLLTDTPMATDVMAEADTPEAEQLKQIFAAETAAQKLDFTGKYEPRTIVNENQLFLANDCNMSKSENGVDSLHLNCTNGQTLNLALNQELRFALINMLQLVTKEAAWDFSFSAQASLLTNVTGSKAVH